MRSALHITSVLVAGALAAAVAACSGGGGEAATATPPSGQETLTLSAQGNAWAPALLRVRAGQKYKVEVKDVNEAHTFTVSPWNVNVFIPETGAPPFDLVVPTDAAGKVPFFCSLHAGMTGDMEVQGR